MNKILIIEACFYQDVATLLREGAIDVLNKQGHEYEIETVPGALEIPAALNFFISGKKKYDAYVVLGCVIRGETSHYDIVCNESARGVYDLVLKHNLALGNGILTVENKDQAIARADQKKKNKGEDAAKAALHDPPPIIESGIRVNLVSRNGHQIMEALHGKEALYGGANYRIFASGGGVDWSGSQHG